MSKNYELLQQEAEFGFGLGPAFRARTSTAGVESAAPGSAEVAQVLPSLESGAREEASKLVQRLFLIPQEKPVRAVVFAGIDAYRGCNWLCSVTARLLASTVPGSVCLVEGNFRSPSLIDSFKLARTGGLVDSLRLDRPVLEFTRQLATDNLWLLPAGAPAEDSTALLNSDRMKDRLRELREEFDYLIVNAPPLGAFGDGLVLGTMVDGVVLVLEANATRREAAVRVTENLRMANIPVLGAVLNNRTFPIPAAVYKRL